MALISNAANLDSQRITAVLKIASRHDYEGLGGFPPASASHGAHSHFISQRSEYRTKSQIILEQRLKKATTTGKNRVNEGRIPENRDTLRLLAKEMAEWPDVDVKIESQKGKGFFGRSVYAKATDTGIDPVAAAKRLNIDWDSAADIDEGEDEDEEDEVPSAVGYGALYLLTAFPVIIGISVVLILFYNSLQ
ncbi:unnamed protein product [Triticum turgidum subsp. durum]|uniref:Uncharacterized protein n=1 Tax=Triticum turgidum subsp. durum TaxID=4567 RepID=A0A9R0RQN4_TRITD|nr:unnamed protein product [Triticum turgidum subsp. durum]